MHGTQDCNSPEQLYRWLRKMNKLAIQKIEDLKIENLKERAKELEREELERAAQT